MTMGDPAGVGPELVLRALASREIADLCQLIVFGDYAVLQACAAQTGLALPEVDLLQASDLARFPKSLCTSAVVNLQAIEPLRIRDRAGQRCLRPSEFCLHPSALDAALAGQIDAITTAPINKERFTQVAFTTPDTPRCLLSEPRRHVGV
ncbi:MAG: hypothetical protein R3C56_09480 [Pirellulaceae bacterium]